MSFPGSEPEDRDRTNIRDVALPALDALKNSSKLFLTGNRTIPGPYRSYLTSVPLPAQMSLDPGKRLHLLNIPKPLWFQSKLRHNYREANPDNVSDYMFIIVQ